MFGQSRESKDKDHVIEILRGLLAEERKLNKELMDRLMAKSFNEYQAMKDREENEVDIKEPSLQYPVPGTVAYEAEPYETQ